MKEFLAHIWCGSKYLICKNHITKEMDSTLGRYLPTRLPTQVESLVLLFVSASLYLAFRHFRHNEDESPVHFTIQTPDQCNSGWKAQVVDEPDIKVRTSLTRQMSLRGAWKLIQALDSWIEWYTMLLSREWKIIGQH